MTDIIAALNMLEEEKNISKEMMIDSIEKAIISACERDFGKDAVKVHMDPETGEITVTAPKQVVDEKGDPVFDCPDTFKATVKVSYNGGRTFISAPFYYVDELNQARQLGTEDGTNFT